MQLYLLNVERGDVPYTKNLLKALGKKKNILDIDCQDPLGRSALVISIENENLEMMQLLLENGIAIKVLFQNRTQYPCFRGRAEKGKTFKQSIIR